MEGGSSLGYLMIHVLLQFAIFHRSAARDLAAKGNPSNFQPIHGHTPFSSAMLHDPSLKVFFKAENLKAGVVIPLYFPIKDPLKTPNLLPQEEADSIPFSSSQLPYLLDFFGLHPHSVQANSMKQTLKHCEFPPLEGETKFCAASLESMLENLRAIFGQGVDFKVLTTTYIENSSIPLKNYTILSPKQVEVQKMMGCHTLPYPYAVFYCHGQKGDTKIYLIKLRDEQGQIIEAVGVCHMDTSHWDPNHIAFQVLGVKPGEAPICHVFPSDNMVWIPISQTSTQ